MVIPSRDTNAFFITVGCKMKAAAPAAGLDLKFVDVKNADYGVQGFTTALQQAQAKSPDVIMTDVPDPSAMNTTLKDITSNGAKLITYNGTVKDESIPNGQVTTDTVQTGVMAADKMAELTGSKGQFLIIDFGPGNLTTNSRAKGFIDQIKAKYSGMSVLPTQYDNADPSKTTQIINATLAAHPDLAGIWFTYNGAAINGLAAVKDAAKPGQIKVVASDADPAEVTYLKQGYIQALLPQNAPVIVADIIKRTKAALDDKKIDPVTLQVPPVVVTKDNMNDPKVQAALYKSTC
jgi:ribose transport system substrate-binding protein